MVNNALWLCYYPCTDIFENQNSHEISFGFIVLGKLSSEYSNLLVKLSQITKKKVCHCISCNLVQILF